ncbi:UNKNOWN [Stylonychia lemnae]|uniref:DUF4485 domain-containing protein n=1 Tax=Stylonychia lemnae TaxID=5949 RepID=A0A078A9L5_STYLE|nr:UNKNOWN [Stylonychia lemnae]|eukprot:CDW78282.1 UNKNOWN [Stylonychia lemnae]
MVTQNLQWKKNRNLYSMLLLDQILNRKLGKPFIKMPTDESLPMLAPAEVKAQLSEKFKKFSSKLNCENAQEKLLQEDEIIPKYEYTPPVNNQKFKNQTTNTSVRVDIPRPQSSIVQTQQKQPIQQKSQSMSISAQLSPKIQQNVSQLKCQDSSTSLIQIDQPHAQNLNTIKSILKHTAQQENKKKAHKFVMSPKTQRPQSKNLRFQAQNNIEDSVDFDRQMASDMGTFKIRFDDDAQKDDLSNYNNYQARIDTTGGEIAHMPNNELQSQVIKLKTDNEILNITMKHLKQEMNMKSEVIRKQTQEMQELRQMILDLQAENQRLKNQEQISKLTSNSANNKENHQNYHSQRMLSPTKIIQSSADLNNRQISEEVDKFNPFRSRTFAYQNDVAQIYNLRQDLSKKGLFQNEYTQKPNTQDHFKQNSQPLYNKTEISNAKISKPYKYKKDYKRVKKMVESDSESNTDDDSQIKKIIHTNERQLQSFDDEFNKIFNNFNSNFYKSKQEQIAQNLGLEGELASQTKAKRDGTILRSKKQIVEDYDSHSILLGIPFTMIYHIFNNQPQVWNYGLKTAPYRKFAIQYLKTIGNQYLLNLIFSDRRSPIYDTRRNSFELRQIIKETNQNHSKTLDGKAHKTLTEEEILNEKKGGNIL